MVGIYFGLPQSPPPTHTGRGKGKGGGGGEWMFMAPTKYTQFITVVEDTINFLNNTHLDKRRFSFLGHMAVTPYMDVTPYMAAIPYMDTTTSCSILALQPAISSLCVKKT